MKAVVITAPNCLSVEEIPKPVPGPKEVLLKVSSVGICGTDLHILEGRYAPRLPITPGHEFAGVVVEVGEDVSNIQVGDQVAADPNIFCGACVRCRSGRTNLCEQASAIGIDLPGAMAEFVVVSSATCVVLPAGVDLQSASLIEPLSCAVHAFDVLASDVGKHFLVYGAGPMGLILASFASRALSASVSVVDLSEERLQWAKEAGATAVATRTTQLGRQDFDVVIDCTGAAVAIEDGISLLAPGGTFVQFGVPRADVRVSISPERLLMHELRLTGSRAVHRSFGRAADIFVAKAVDPAVIISDRFRIEDTLLAFDQFRAGRGRKIIILPS